MIRINLIGDKKGKPKFKAPANMLEFVVIGLLIALGFVGIFFWYQYEEDRLAYARQRVNTEKRAIRGLARAKKDFQNFKKKKKLLKEQLDIIEKLRAKKRGPVRVLDEISTRIPKQVWLKSIDQKKTLLLIRGEAETNEAVAIFFKRLQDSPFFRSVELQQIVRRESTRDGKKMQVTVFSLSCQAVFTAT